MSQPWLDRKQWTGNQISSGSKYAHWALAVFALIWNGISFPIVLQFDDLMGRVAEEPVVLVAFLFPLVGLGLIAAVVHAFLAWRKFGPAPLVLDPFPGSLGGHVGGWIDTRIPFDANQRFDVCLTCSESRMTGSGKNRKRSESVEWQTDGVCYTERSGKGTELYFRFDVPERLPASATQRSGTYHLWRVSVACEMDGPDFNRRYDIPVFPTRMQSTLKQGTESHAGTIDQAMEGVESVADIRPVAGGVEAFFPAFQRPGQGIGAIIFGLVFAAVGIAVGYSEDGGIMIPAVFTLLGTLIAGYGTWYLGKSLLVGVTGEGVRCRRFLFGYPLKTRQLPRTEFTHFDIDSSSSTTSGNKTTVYYQLYAKGRSDESLPVGERLTSRAEAELLKETFETYLGA